MRSDERSLTSMVLKEIENQIEDKVVPVISSIMGSGRAREHTASLCGDKLSKKSSSQRLAISYCLLTVAIPDAE